MNRRRKLLMMSGGISATKLFNDFKARVTADGGTISDEAFILSFFQMVVQAKAVKYCQDHAIILFPEARRLTVSTTNVNKKYSLFDPAYDATQTSAGIQPALISADRNGRDAINYVDGRRMNLLSSKALDFTRNTDYVEILAVHNSFSDVANPYVMFFSAASLAIRAVLGTAGGNERMGARRLDSDSLSSATVDRINNYRYVSGRNRYDLGEIRLFRNNAEVAINDTLTKGMTEDTPSFSVTIGARSDGLANSFLDGKALPVIAFNTQVPPSFRTALDNFIMNAYDLPA